MAENIERCEIKTDAQAVRDNSLTARQTQQVSTLKLSVNLLQFPQAAANKYYLYVREVAIIH